MMTDTAVPVVNAGYEGMGAGADWFLWLIVIFALLFNGNGFGFGGNASEALTQAELQSGLYNQTMERNLSDIRTSQCNTDMLINQNNYNTLLQSKELSAQLAECCCQNRYESLQNTNNLMVAMNENTQKILDKMCQSEIDTLREKLNDAKNVITNNEQTGVLLSTMGRWHAFPSCGCGYGSCTTYSQNLI